MSLLTTLRNRFRQGIGALGVDPDEYLPLIQPTNNPQFGDFQANCAMPLGKRLGRPPRQIAEEIARQTELGDLCQPVEIAGPGFINLRILDRELEARLRAAVRSDRLGIAPCERAKTVVVDFSSPNVAKPLHVGHIRSTVLGDALARMLRFAGHRVITDNHLGDWGTQFGMVIYGYKHFLDADAYRAEPVQELGRLYRIVRELMDILDLQDARPGLQQRIAAQEERLRTVESAATPSKEDRKKVASLRDDLQASREEQAQAMARLDAVQKDPQLAKRLAEHVQVREAVLSETARLHAGDPENLGLWREFLPHCRREIQTIYDRLGVAFDHEYGESYYHEQLAAVVGELEVARMLTESEGAKCVFCDGFETPMIVQKRDGAFLYATTDLATLAYRARQWNPDAILYVVDSRQSEHFAKLFDVGRRWGYGQIDLRHVKFGTILGPDHRPFKTRAGTVVGLVDLLDEAETQAYQVLVTADRERTDGPPLDEAQKRQIARVVGTAAIKYSDLSQNRESDYVFSYEKMLAMQGNTATYMQYSYARVHGIVERGQVNLDELRETAEAIRIEVPEERVLALNLLRLGDAIDEALVDYRPNLLTNYLFELAKSFSTFFESCPVLKAETPERRRSRLLLCDLTARTLKLGLGLLGIDVIDRM